MAKPSKEALSEAEKTLASDSSSSSAKSAAERTLAASGLEPLGGGDAETGAVRLALRRSCSGTTHCGQNDGSATRRDVQGERAGEIGGQRAERLGSLLLEEGLRLASAKPKAPRIADLSGSSADQIELLFREFGGIGPAERLRPGPWDLVLASGVMVELDEQSHFTRYRGRTLREAFSNRLPWASPYSGYCERFEPQALRHGGYWRNKSADAMFGPSDAAGTFMGLGSSRWKQRAVYDAVKDAAAHDALVRLARVSIYDDIGGVQLGRVLEGRAALNTGVLAAWIASRTR